MDLKYEIYEKYEKSKIWVLKICKYFVKVFDYIKVKYHIKIVHKCNKDNNQ